VMQGPRAEELAATLHPDTDKVNGFPGCGKQLTQGYASTKHPTNT